MPAGESLQHRRLKQLALAWARERGWAAGATEVRVPRSGFRADVVAMADPTTHECATVAIFECKQSRADWRKDAHDEEALRVRTTELTERQRSLEAMFAVHRPELRRGEALWPEFDAWDEATAEHRTYRRVLGDLATLRRRAGEGTKFARMHRWRCADRLYVVVEENVHARAERPRGWGVLVRRDDRLVVEREPEDLAISPAQRTAWRDALARKLAGPPPALASGLASGLLFAESA